MRATKNNSFHCIYAGGQFITLTLFIIMLLDSCLMETSILFLPLAFFVVNLLFLTNYVQQDFHMTKFMVFILYFVRLSVLPLLYYVSGESRLYEGNILISAENIQKAACLMTYEYFIVQLTIFLHEKVKFRSHRFKFVLNYKGYNSFPKVLFAMAFFALAVYIFFPEVRGSFKSLLKLNAENFTISDYLASNEQVGSIRRIVATLFSFVFAMIRILLPAYFLIRAKRKCKSGVVVLIVSIIVQFVFITSTFAHSLVSALIIVILFGHLYPEKRKFLFVMTGVSTIGIGALYFLVRYSVSSSLYSENTSFISYMARIVSAYFTGIENVAGCFHVENGVELETAISDFMGAIPFNTTLFGGWEGDKFQTYFNSANHSYGQIPPAIGSGYYHFGWILSPIYVVLMLKLSMFFCEKAKNDDNPWKYAVNTFCCTVFALGMVMYNEAIAFSWYFGWAVPMLLLLKFTNKDEFA